MKNLLTLFCLLILSASATAQAPQAINYQAVARNAAGQPLVNQSVGLQLSVLDGSATGTALYVERFTLSTNDYGLFTLQIGTGTVQSGAFNTINWGASSRFLKVELDPAGGTAYTLSGASQFVSVPYALVSQRATGMALDDLTNVSAAAPATNDVLTWNGTAWTPAGAGTSGWGLSGNAGTTAGNFIGTTDNQPLRFGVNGQNAGMINPASNSVALGQLALDNNTTGSYNIAVGTQALNGNITGGTNVAVGANAAAQNTGGSHNVAMGGSALFQNTTGQYNTALGRSALSQNTTGGYNTALGANAGVGTGSGTLTNSTAIGANARVDASNSLVLGSIAGVNAATADTKVGIGTTTPQQALHVRGKVRVDTLNSGAATDDVLTIDANGVLGKRVTPAAASNYWTQTGNDIRNNNSGRIGINAAPIAGYRLSVKDSGARTGSGGSMIVQYGDTATNYTSQPIPKSTLTGSSRSSVGVIGKSDSADGIRGYSNYSSGVYGSSQYAAGGNFYSLGSVGLYAHTDNANIPAAQLISGNGNNGFGLQVFGYNQLTGKTCIGNLTFPLSQMLEVDGGVQIGTVADAAGTTGTIRYNSTLSKFQGYNGTTWQDMTGGGASPWTQNGNQIYPTITAAAVGIGTTTPTAKLEVAGALLSQGTSGATPVSGSGTRMMWVPAKAAFRAGTVSGAQWDNTSIGQTSAAFGNNNTASGASTLAAGENNSVSASYSAVVGDNNTVDQSQSFASGHANSIVNSFGVSGTSAAFGTSNTVSGFTNFAAGNSHTISNSYGVALGNTNTVSGYAAVAIGDHSTATGNTAIVLGNQCSASGQTSIAAGFFSTADGAHSVALGSHAHTSGKTGAFVLGDYPDPANPFSTPTASLDNQLTARFLNGYRFYTDVFLSTGVQVTPGGSSWSFLSDSTKKTNFRKVDGEYLLGSIAKMKAGTWNYKTQDAARFRHYGPMAQEFFRYFGKDALGTIGCDTLIASQDMEGVLFLAVQALEKRTSELKEATATIEAMQKSQASLEERLSKMEAVLQQKEQNGSAIASGR